MFILHLFLNGEKLETTWLPEKKNGDSLKNNYRTSNVAIPVWLFTQSFLRSPDPFLSGKYNAK